MELPDEESRGHKVSVTASHNDIKKPSLKRVAVFCMLLIIMIIKNKIYNNSQKYQNA